MPLLSGFSCELFLALWTGNGDFALPPGNPYRLSASWTTVIAMLLIPPPFQQHQKPSVFPIALIGISGQTAKQHQTHQ